MAYCWQKSKDHSANLSAAERAKRLSQMRRRAKKTLMERDGKEESWKGQEDEAEGTQVEGRRRDGRGVGN